MTAAEELAEESRRQKLFLYIHRERIFGVIYFSDKSVEIDCITHTKQRGALFLIINRFSVRLKEKNRAVPDQ